MQRLQTIVDLQTQGRLHWTATRQAWMASPGDVIEALTREGFEEYRRVASAIWVRAVTPCEALVFIDIDGEPVEVSHQ